MALGQPAGAESSTVEPSPQMNTVAILGDSQHDEAVHRRIVELILKERPVAVFSVGDQVNDGTSRRQWARFNAVIAPLQKVSRYYPCLGNHEMNSPLYYQNFELPNNERWYTVTEGGIRFIVLDSNAPLTPDTDQYQWLVKTLNTPNPTDDFTALIFHHPLFSTSAYHEKDEKGWGPALLPLIKKYGVDIVFNGHAHNYERSFYDGTYHIVTSGGGAHLRDQARQSPYSQVFAKEYHFCLLKNSDGVLDITVINATGKIIDTFNVVHRAPAAEPAGRH